jgi:EAL domain-containing protein (putative c-di-GMP-specific phosphodiesterase class I)
LVVDDERIQRMIITRVVASMGYAADSAGTLEDAAALLSTYRYDAVVLDLSLGESEGISLLQALRHSLSDPVLVFISRLDDRVRAASTRLAVALGLRVAGAIQKPVSPTALRTLLLDAPMRERVEPNPRSPRLTPDDLVEALRREEIAPQFQPKVALADGRVVGVEALARWTSPAFGIISPDAFIPPAEEHGLIVPLTFHILRQSLLACKRWRAFSPACSVAVNISPLVLADPALPEEIEQILHETGLGPGSLVAEITESTVIANPLIAAEVLTRLRIKGVSLSIDDFGTGYSSLLTLLRLPFSELKVDRSFVTQCDTDPEAWKIVRATISMARELGLTVVAEGIETEPVERMLREAGCEVGQGWHFARAMKEDELTQWLSKHAAVPA